MHRSRSNSIILLALVAVACSTPRGGEIDAGYLFQAARGQLELINRARPLGEVLSDPRLDPHYRRALEEVPRIKHFGEEMGLRATPNYTDFVDLKRDAAVYVVSGCESLRFEALRWSFPLVGGFSYLGWFDRESAVAMRDRIRAEGFDADVRGAAAYSTLGWFRDPVLSTLIGKGESVRFIETLLHESVHATLHLKSLSSLNESLAQFVAEKITPLYLERHRSPEARSRYERGLAEERRMDEAFHAAYARLEGIYGSAQGEGVKKLEKQKVLDALRKEVGWPEGRELNNATLIQFATYESGGKGFEAIWKACQGSLVRFLGAISKGEEKLRLAGERGLDRALEELASGCAR